jgi:hypothetical protein
MQIAPGNPAANWLDNRMRPKLAATKVSGCHPIPVICGQQPHDATQSQDLGRVATGKSFPGHHLDRHRRGRTLLKIIPPDTVTGSGSRGRPANRLNQATIAHQPGHKTAKERTLAKVTRFRGSHPEQSGFQAVRRLHAVHQRDLHGYLAYRGGGL